MAWKEPAPAISTATGDELPSQAPSPSAQAMCARCAPPQHQASPRSSMAQVKRWPADRAVKLRDGGISTAPGVSRTVEV